jgi:hypothetical protein
MLLDQLDRRVEFGAIGVECVDHDALPLMHQERARRVGDGCCAKGPF